MTKFDYRTLDPTLVECEDCGWTGRVMDCIHRTEAHGFTMPDGNVDCALEDVDLCPKCASKNLLDPRARPVLAGARG